MRSTRKYLPCCRDYRGCDQHYPPGIDGFVQTFNPLSRITNLFSLALERITIRKGNTPGGRSLLLPAELLQQIAGYLPLASRAAFALCSKHICHAIGRESWNELGKVENRKDRFAFLALLEKDIKDHW